MHKNADQYKIKLNRFTHDSEFHVPNFQESLCPNEENLWIQDFKLQTCGCQAAWPNTKSRRREFLLWMRETIKTRYLRILQKSQLFTGRVTSHDLSFRAKRNRTPKNGFFLDQLESTTLCLLVFETGQAGSCKIENKECLFFFVTTCLICTISSRRYPFISYFSLRFCQLFSGRPKYYISEQ